MNKFDDIPWKINQIVGGNVQLYEITAYDLADVIQEEINKMKVNHEELSQEYLYDLFSDIQNGQIEVGWLEPLQLTIREHLCERFNISPAKEGI